MDKWEEKEQEIALKDIRVAKFAEIKTNPASSAVVTALYGITNSMMSSMSTAAVPCTLGILGAATAMNLEHCADISRPLSDMALSSAISSTLELQTRDALYTMATGALTASEYMSELTALWNKSKYLTSVTERSIAAQKLAVVRFLPNFNTIELPRGGKSVFKSLTKQTTEKLVQANEIQFDPKDLKFYHKSTPERKLSADQIAVVESSQDLFAGISLDEIISFESQLFEDTTFALEHPVGRKIFEIIKNWNRFINFDADIYFHARKIEDGQPPFLDQDMMKAPQNVSSHGRYNAIGKSCFYLAETKDGALKEITKHSGGRKVNIQVVGLKPVKPAKIFDLSGDANDNRFLEHLRFTVENEEGKIVKKYLLPNFVASCCKRIGIEGIKYQSTGYNCLVLWNDGYFEFVEGSRDIVYRV